MTTSIEPSRWSMSYARALTCLLVLMMAPGAQAQEEEDPDLSSEESEDTEPEPAPAEPNAEPPWKTRFGARLVAGSPDGVGVAALIHPRRWVRVHAGAAKNSLGVGVRGGLSIIPLELYISPTLELEYGHYFNADYGALLTQLHGRPITPASGIGKVGYDQFSGGLNLEFSPSRYVTVFGGFGISYWFIGVNQVKDFIREAENDPDITARPLTLGLSSPMAKLGLIIHFN